MAMKKVKVEDAVGMVLGHDLTKIVPGQYKGPAFRKGRIIRQEDIPHLKDIGKDHIFLLELGPGQVHEAEAVTRIASAVAGKNIVLTEAAEGRVNLKAAESGLLKVKSETVAAVNNVEHAVFSTLHSNRLVAEGDLVAGIKVIPLVVEEAMVAAVEAIAGEQEDIISVVPLRSLKVGVVITGNEVYYGRIEDKFAPVLAEKVARYGAIFLGAVYRPDDAGLISAAIRQWVEEGAELVIASGGMSVDPDDVTPDAIRQTGAEVVCYGTPVLPGAMFMLAYLGGTAILGMPACGMYSQTTVFDLIFPRLLAGERLGRRDFAAMGYGGLCTACKSCAYPHCPFGKG